MAGKEGCYKCGDMGHKIRDCQVASIKGGRDSKRARCNGGTSQPKPDGNFSASTISKCSKYGINHKGECLAGLDAYYRCGKLGHHTSECKSGTRPLDLAQTIGRLDQSATMSDCGQRQDRLYAF
ncbi:cold shock protein 1-like [Solanum dulcamara]|uniref:cold shock protein 1-like n=1 Tax=Solanum dulcamara TaxID=45834 RepID=UPI0024856C60|nr:cold shock protein 1-like [Solanum dulcamara]